MKRFLSIMLSLLVILPIFVTTNSFAKYIDGWNYGDVRWEINDSTLTIYGNGEMPEEYNRYRCWNDYSDLIKTIVIEDGVTSIADDAFSGFKKLENITIPDSVTMIGKGAFAYCSSLESIIIPNSVKTINMQAFEGCSKLKNVTLPKGIKRIDQMLFWFCESLETVTIPYGVESIDYQAFSACDGLKNVTIPDTVSVIGAEAFGGCDNLESIHIPYGIKTIERDTFSYCKKLKNIEIPRSVQTIEQDAFSHCQRLQSVEIPGNVKEIKYRAFEGCDSLYSITIPDSVISVYPHAFSDCKNLSKVSFSEKTNIADDAFQNCFKLGTELSKDPNSISRDEFDKGMAKGIAYFNKAMYYEAKDEFQWFCDYNWGRMNEGQQKYALDYLGGAKAKIAEWENKQYYSGTNIPTYTNFTGRTVSATTVRQEGSQYLYQYPINYNDDSIINESNKYMTMIRSLGWKNYSQKRSEYGITFYFRKNASMIGVNIDFKNYTVIISMIIK